MLPCQSCNNIRCYANKIPCNFPCELSTNRLTLNVRSIELLSDWHLVDKYCWNLATKRHSMIWRETPRAGSGPRMQVSTLDEFYRQVPVLKCHLMVHFWNWTRYCLSWIHIIPFKLRGFTTKLLILIVGRMHVALGYFCKIIIRSFGP